MQQKIQALRTELEGLQAKLQDPGVFSTPEYPALARRQNYLESTIALYDFQQVLTEQLAEARELASGDDELAELAAIEVAELETKLAETSDQLDGCPNTPATSTPQPK
jgi:protein subunit release factor A